MIDEGSPAWREKIQRQLDEALADSFPASDPVSIVTSNEEEDWGADPGISDGQSSPPDGGRTKPAQEPR